MAPENGRNISPMNKRAAAHCWAVLQGQESPCIACGIRSFSIWSNLGAAAFKQPAEMSELVAIGKGDEICGEGDPMHYFYNLHSGVLKISRLQSGRRNLVTGFLFAGDSLGLAMFAGQGESNRIYPYSVKALTKACICRLPFQQFWNLSRNNLK